MSPAAKQPDETTYGGRFAARLRILREKSGLSVDEVIERMKKFNSGSKKVPGIQAYYGWEQGSASPHLELLPAIAKAFKVKIRELLPEK